MFKWIKEKINAWYSQWSKWEWEAGRIYQKNPNFQVCRHRVAKLGIQMYKQGEKFDIVSGKAKHGDGLHIWIEQDGKVIDPMQRSGTRDRYNETYRWKINQGKFNDDRRFLIKANQWINEVK